MMCVRLLAALALADALVPVARPAQWCSTPRLPMLPRAPVWQPPDAFDTPREPGPEEVAAEARRLRAAMVAAQRAGQPKTPKPRFNENLT